MKNIHFLAIKEETWQDAYNGYEHWLEELDCTAIAVVGEDGTHNQECKIDTVDVSGFALLDQMASELRIGGVYNYYDVVLAYIKSLTTDPIPFPNPIDSDVPRSSWVTLRNNVVRFLSGAGDWDEKRWRTCERVVSRLVEVELYRKKYKSGEPVDFYAWNFDELGMTVLPEFDISNENTKWFIIIIEVKNI